MAGVSQGLRKLLLLYDAEGSPIGFLMNGIPYTYVKNIQGDIIKILDMQGNAVVSYTYDPWGVPTATGNTIIAEINPCTYRGYDYDEDTGYFYLQSRYYDPTAGRFLSADSPAFAAYLAGGVSSNLFLYCYNSPINYKDSTGLAADIIFDVASTVASLLQFIGKPSWANFGWLVWDLAAAIVPFIPGSYVKNGGKLVISVADKIADFSKGSSILTGSYNKLKKLFKKIKGIDIHHLVEKRFKRLFDCSAGSFLSIPLTKDLHKLITKRWRDLYKKSEVFRYFKYGADYSKITYSAMEKAIKEVYKDMPELLNEVLRWFRTHWKG